MSLASVLYPSPTRQGWKEWSWANFQHHLAIDTGLLQVAGYQYNPYRLWPVDEHDFRGFLEQHNQSHQVFNSVLGINGQDLSELDLEDKTMRDSWFFSHYTQHQAAAQLLGLAIL